MRTRLAPGRALIAAAGLALIAVGLHGVATSVEAIGWVVWFVVPVLVHDAVLVPSVLAAGWLTGRLPAPSRTPVRAALAAAGCLTLVALPLVLGDGRRADVPSRLPLPYGRNLAVVLTALAVAAALTAAVRLHRARRTGPTARPTESSNLRGTASNPDAPGDEPADGTPVIGETRGDSAADEAPEVGGTTDEPLAAEPPNRRSPDEPVDEGGPGDRRPDGDRTDDDHVSEDRTNPDRTNENHVRADRVRADPTEDDPTEDDPTSNGRTEDDRTEDDRTSNDRVNEGSPGGRAGGARDDAGGSR